MRFGSVPMAEAAGGIAVHSVRHGELVLKKGTVIGLAEIETLVAAGVARIMVVRLDPDDVGEDAAAATIACAAAGADVRIDAPFTGRANLFAEAAGVLVVERSGIDALNAVDEAITIATLPAYKPVAAGEMVATVKIIPYAVPSRVLARACAGMPGPLVRVAPYRLAKVGVVSTELPGLAAQVIDKTLRITGERLRPMGAVIAAEVRVPHEAEALADALRQMVEIGVELVVVFGASAIADRRDVIPTAIEAAGGMVDRLGMPVDPGNLLLVGSLGEVPVLGAPGCARSPRENGFDWVLARLVAGLPVTRADITGFGVGGLLTEIVTRPQPRAGRPRLRLPQVAAVVLAAGRSTRMGGPNKLVEALGGVPLVRQAVMAAVASRATPVIVVTGHQRERVTAALIDLPVMLVDNPAYAEGLSTSVKAGITAVPETVDGAVILLGDMPRVDAALINRLIAAFDTASGGLVAVPVREGKRGNPVLWPRRFFADLEQLKGDAGARHLIGQHARDVVEVPVSNDAAFLDVDTPEALAAARASVEA